MPKMLSDDTVRAYQRDGYYFPLRVFTAQEAGACLPAARRSPSR